MKRIIFFLTFVVFSLSVTVLPVMAGDTSTEIEQLKGEVTKLLRRIEELEKKQTVTEAKTVEIENKGLQAGYDKGFYIKTRDGNFLLKTNVFLQFRYTDLFFDRKVNANDEDWSNFFIRRARVIFSGNAPDKDWTYFFHLQLEPTSSVNLHDAYVTWKRYPSAQ